MLRSYGLVCYVEKPAIYLGLFLSLLFYHPFKQSTSTPEGPQSFWNQHHIISVQHTFTNLWALTTKEG